MEHPTATQLHAVPYLNSLSGWGAYGPHTSFGQPNPNCYNHPRPAPYLASAVVNLSAAYFPLFSWHSTFPNWQLLIWSHVSVPRMAARPKNLNVYGKGGVAGFVGRAQKPKMFNHISKCFEVWRNWWYQLQFHVHTWASWELAQVEIHCFIHLLWTFCWKG